VRLEALKCGEHPPMTQPVRLPNAVPSERYVLETRSGAISFYRGGPEASAVAANPLLLIHSINAAGSSYEMRPIFEHHLRSRAVYAIDLPGFGFSARSDRPYSVRLMTDAIHSVVDHIRREQGGRTIDAAALSLSSEFLARAASERPACFRTLALISPTGFDESAPYLDAPGTTRAMPMFYRFLRFPLWDRGVFRLLTTRRSIRYFLQRTWGSKKIDEGMLEYDYLTTHQPGARFAPYYFVSGYLFSRDITNVYESLPLSMPVWLSHGVRGDFQDFSYAKRIAGRPNWVVTEFASGALPHFERPRDFLESYQVFLDQTSC
jgi:pimeloyl-ACP methyl ester carboxylesterase